MTISQLARVGPSLGNGDAPGVTVVIGLEKVHGVVNFFEVDKAINALSLGFGATERGKKHRGENGNDGYDHQQLNERECEDDPFHRRMALSLPEPDSYLNGPPLSIPTFSR